MADFQSIRDEYDAELRRYIKSVNDHESKMIEEALEKALVGGQHGVFVLRDPQRRVVSAEPHFAVPYGFIYEARETSQMEFFRKRRC